MDPVTWTLYLYLGQLGAIEVDGKFETKTECIKRGDKAVSDFRDLHTHAPAFRWCVRGEPESKQ